MNKNFCLVLIFFISTSVFYSYQKVHGTPFFSNGYFTENGIEWCEENLSLYEILQEKFFEHHRHSLESRVCVSLYQDYYWTYEGVDRIEKLIERSKHYSQLEISESYEESKTGVIDTSPAKKKDETILLGITEDKKMMVQIISSSPRINESMEINLLFLDEDSVLLRDINFEISIIQKDQMVISKNNLFSEKGLFAMNTRPLNSDEPVIIKITINGIGSPDNPETWIEPKGKIVMFRVVPEFGDFTIILLSILFSFAIFVNFKNKSILWRQHV